MTNDSSTFLFRLSLIHAAAIDLQVSVIAPQCGQ
jgi:hypothetical protein